jgi:hypothetical protein
LSSIEPSAGYGWPVADTRIFYHDVNVIVNALYAGERQSQPLLDVSLYFICFDF